MESASTKEHKESSPAKVRIAIITASSTRTKETDESGKLIAQLASEHQVVKHIVLKDNAALIRNEIMDCLIDSFHQVDAIIISGGTGIGRKDVTIEAVKPILEKELNAFPMLFAALSYQDNGSAAMLSRSIAGILRGKIVFCIPGSPEAVQLAMQELILPELAHIVGHLQEY